MKVSKPKRVVGFFSSRGATQVEQEALHAIEWEIGIQAFRQHIASLEEALVDKKPKVFIQRLADELRNAGAKRALAPDWRRWVVALAKADAATKRYAWVILHRWGDYSHNETLSVALKEPSFATMRRALKKHWPYASLDKTPDNPPDPEVPLEWQSYLVDPDDGPRRRLLWERFEVFS